MKKLACCCLGLFLVAPVAAEEVSRRLSSTPVAVTDDLVRIELEVGELEIIGSDGEELAAYLTATCRKGKPKCVRKLEELEIAVIAADGRVDVVFEGVNKRRARKMELEVLVEVPRANSVEVKMGVGELEIEDLRRDLSVDMWIGDATIRMAEADVHSVLLDTGIGDGEIYSAGHGGRERRPFLVGKEIAWTSGQGAARVDLDLQIGDISVELH